MLIEFSAENYRAIREKQTLSLIPNDIERLEPPHHVADTGIPAAPRLLLDACLFGANGSGKTSFVDAMTFMINFVHTSSQRGSGDPIPVIPFILNPKWTRRPSEFEVVFTHDDAVYQYGFVVTRSVVLKEWLFCRTNGARRWRVIFERNWNAKDKSHDWKPVSSVKGGRRSWIANTRSNALFLSVAEQYNAGGDIKRAYEWIMRHFKTFSTMERGNFGSGYTTSKLKEEGWNKRIVDFMGDIGISLNKITVESKSIYETSMFGQLNKVGQDILRQQIPDGELAIVYFFRDEDHEASVPIWIDMESAGTKALLELAGPILDTLDKGSTIVIDEINLGLHPLALQNLIAMFCSPEVNPRNAQIIFTTHDPSIVELAFVERDQVWLADKNNKDFAARIVSLTEFEGTGTSSFAKDYLQGRYGCVPSIRRKL